MLNMRHYCDVADAIRRCESLLSDVGYWHGSKARLDGVQRKARALLKGLMALKKEWDGRMEGKKDPIITGGNG
jgi:hypothetical protein